MVQSGSWDEHSASGASAARTMPTAAGRVRSLTGESTIRSIDGSVVRAEIGTLLRPGDVIETGSDARIGITLADGTAFDLKSESRLALNEFECGSDETLSSALVEVSKGSFAFVAGKTAMRDGLSIRTPFATLRASAFSGALVSLTLAAVTIALLDKLQAAGNDPILLDDLIRYKDLEHGTLGIVPKGGERRLIILDDPEMTIIIGPPESGYAIQQILNSSGIMAVLLAASQDANAIYLLGQADPFTTGSISGQRADSGIILFPDTFTRPVNFFHPLPAVSDEGSPGGNTPNPPPANAPQILVLDLNENIIVEHDHTSGVQVHPDGEIDDTEDPFPIDLGDLEGFDPDLVIGQARDGTAGDPFVSTAGSSGPVRITVEPSSNGVDSGLDVTGGGSIFLFKETTDGQQVVVGREGGPDGPIAFIIFVTPDGRSIWVQELLPIKHTDPADSPTDISNDPDSIVSILDNVLLVRGTLSGSSLTKTAPIGGHIAFVDDAPVAKDDDLQVVAEATSINGNVINPQAADDPNASGKDDPGTDGAKVTHIDIGAGLVAIASGVSVGGGFYQHSNAFGTYTFHENGGWTFAATTNLDNLITPVDASFTYRLTDGDGDFDDAVQPISVIDGADPTGGQLGLAVQEPDLDMTQDGADIAAGTTTGSTPSETAETDSGSLTFTAGSDDVIAFAFGDTDGIVVQGLLGSPIITWTGEGTGTLTGQINGVDAIILTVSGGTIAALESGDATVTATLLDNFPHALLGSDSVLIGGIEVKASEVDGDFGVGRVRVRVLDDVPSPENIDETLVIPGVNVAFVLDYSTSIDNTELNQMLTAVKAAGSELFTEASGEVTITVVAFGSTATTFGPFSDYAAFEAAIDATNPLSGGSRPVLDGTVYTVAIQETIDSFVPDPDAQNQIFFISDGVGSMSPAALTAWTNFINGAVEIDLQTVGIGTGVSFGQLENLEVDGGDPIVIDDFDDLVTTLLGVIDGTVTGSVIEGGTGSGDDFGADGGRIFSFKVGDTVYTWDGTIGDGAIDPGTPGDESDDIAGAELTDITTPEGGLISFDFADGSWSYTAPAGVSEDGLVETFHYSLTDSDGDQAFASLTINVTLAGDVQNLAIATGNLDLA